MKKTMFALALPVALLLAACRNEPLPAPPDSPPLAGLARDDITEIFLHLPREDIRLRRKGSFWHLPDWEAYPADAVYVDMLLGALTDLRRGERITADPADSERYGFGASAKTVSLRDEHGKELAAIQVGNHGANYRESYYKLPGQSEIFLTQTDLFPALSRVTWADRTVWRMAPEAVEEIVVTGFPRDFHVKRTVDQGWQVVQPAGARLPETFVTRDLPRFAFLRAGNIEYEPLPGQRFEARAAIHLRVASLTLSLELGQMDREIILGRKGVDKVIFKFGPSLPRWIESIAPSP